MQKITVMVNGMPGNMARLVAETVQQRGWELIPFSLTGEEVEAPKVALSCCEIDLLKPSIRESKMASIKEKWPKLIAVDYTHPSAVIGNLELYLRHQIPFVMGTTGGDRHQMDELLKSTPVNAVIAPNMAKQIVGFQAMMEWASNEFPDLFRGWNLRVEESHQSTKADTSGTAKAVVASFQKMGLKFDVEQIKKIRQPDEQIRFGVPQKELLGHAFHTYSVDSPDRAVHFEFQHNVCGRQIYADGTADAVAFLFEKNEAGSSPRLYNMFDVLRSGSMR